MRDRRGDGDGEKTCHADEEAEGSLLKRKKERNATRQSRTAQRAEKEEREERTVTAEPTRKVLRPPLSLVRRAFHSQTSPMRICATRGEEGEPRARVAWFEGRRIALTRTGKRRTADMRFVR